MLIISTEEGKRLPRQTLTYELVKASACPKKYRKPFLLTLVTLIFTSGLVASAILSSPPDLANLETTDIAFTEGDLPSAITSTLTVNDIDNVTLEDVRIQITGNYVGSEDVLSFSDAFGIVGNWDNITGTLTLTGPSTLTNFETAIRSVTYQNSNTANPSELIRTLSITAFDGSDYSATVMRNVTVTAVNDAPVAMNDMVITMEDTNVVIDVLANDTDPDNALDPATVIVVTVSSKGTATVNTTTGKITFKPNGNYNGTTTFTYSVKDISGAVSNVATVTVTVTSVNDAPKAVDDFYSTSSNTSLSANLRSNDSDVEGNTISATNTPITPPSNGNVTINTNGTFIYTPNAAFTGTDSFVYQICDDGTDNGVPAPRCGQATVNVIVNPVNTLYNINGNNSIETAPDCFVLTPALNNQQGAVWRRTPLDLRFSFDLTLQAIFSAPGVVNNGGADGIMLALQRDMTPPPANTPASPIEARGSVGAQLGFGGISPSIGIEFDTYQNGGEPAEDHIALSKNGNVGTVIAGPVAAKLDASNTPLNIEDGVYHQIKIMWNKPTNTFTVFFDGVQRITHTEDIVTAIFGGDPTNIYWGFTASTGGQNNHQGVCGLNMTILNAPPTAVNDALLTNEDTPKSGTTLTNDSDPEGGTIAVTPETKATAHGTVTILANGTYTYTPTKDYNGPDSFTYKVCDNYSTPGCSFGTVNITVTPVNDAPIAMADNVVVNEDEVLTAPLPGVLSNDIDVENDALTAILVTSTTRGILVLSSDGSFTYTPEANFNGTDNFTYKVSDGVLTSNIVTVSITVIPVNDAPNAVDDGPILHASQLRFSIDVLQNDSDIDNSQSDLTIVSVSAPTFGSVAIVNNKIIYTPAGSNSGLVTFSYTIEDADGLTSEAIVTIEYTYLPLQASEGFSPNGDGNNDTWYIRAIELYSDNEVVVFDRWGLLVYRAQHYDNTSVVWDGRANIGQQAGKLLEQGTYFYKVTIAEVQGGLSGFVVIVR